MKYKSIVVLTGAGISEESGIKTFRGAHGLWENHRIEDVATPEAFLKNPTLVQRFYNERRRQLQLSEITPNEAHKALYDLEKKASNFTLITQNVDDLHERAGSKNLLHMHGELLKARCCLCQGEFKRTDDLSVHETCPLCHTSGTLRPDIVWFGEMPKHMEEIFEALSVCDLFLCIGTSGVVQPAASFVMSVPENCHKIEVNIEKTPISPYFDEHYFGKASMEVRKLVDNILKAKL